MMKPPFTISNRVINLIAEISVELGKIEASKLVVSSPQLRKQNRIKTIQATLAIEGNTLTLDQVTAVLEGSRVIGPEREILEVRNAMELYEIIETLKPHATRDFLTAHKILMQGLISSAGRFRDKNVGVLKGEKVSHVAPKPKMVPELVQKLFSWSKSEKELHPLIKSCVLHYEIEFIHPFEDGNGRIGRFWQNLQLIQCDPVFKFIPVESLIKIHQQKYYDVLEDCDRAGDCTLFVEFMLELILKSLSELTQGVSGITLTGSQRLELAKEHFGKELFSRKEYMVYFKNISSATASRDLDEGVRGGVLKKAGKANQTRYKFYG